MNAPSPSPSHTFAARCAVLLPALLLGVLALAPLRAADTYRLQVVAFQGDFPATVDNPAAFSGRAFWTPPSTVALASSGVLTFPVQWRDSRLPGLSVQLLAGISGSLDVIAETQKPVPGLPQYAFNLAGFTPSTVQFASWSANNDGEVFFRANVSQPNVTNPGGFSGALWRGHASGLTLLAAYMLYTSNGVQPAGAPPVAVSGLPPTGTRTLVWSNNLAPHGICDNGSVFFSGTINAWDNTGGITAAQDGLFEASKSGGQRLLAYRGGPVPEQGSDRVFRSPLVPLVAPRSGGFAAQAVTSPRTDAEGDTSRHRSDLYEYREGRLRAVHTGGDPLPGLASTPANVDITLVTALDASGNGLFGATAAGNRLGYWKFTAAGKVPVVIFGQDATLASAGSGRFSMLSVDMARSAAIGDGRAVFAAAFTRTGTIQPIEGIFRQTPEGLVQVVAVDGSVVPGTDYILAGPLGSLVMNERGDVLFGARFRRTGESVFSSAVWLADRNGQLHRLISPGENLPIGGVPRAVRAASFLDTPSRALNDSGVVALLVTFADLTQAIVRAVPTGYVDPPRPAKLYRFHGRLGTNWHTKTGNATNWEDDKAAPRPDAPGDADSGTASVLIDSSQIVTLNQRTVAVGAVNAEGILNVNHRLAVNMPSVFRDLRVIGPNALFMDDGTTVNLIMQTRLEFGGRIDAVGAGATIKNQGRFDALDGSISAAGIGAAFENRGTVIKDGPGEVTVTVPMKSFGPDGTAPPREAVEVKRGKLSLSGGGGNEGNVRLRLAKDAGLKLTGDFEVKDKLYIIGPPERDGATKVELGDSEKTIQIQSASGAAITLDVPGAGVEFNRGQLTGKGAVMENRGVLAWNGGRIAFEFGPEVFQRSEFSNLGTVRIQGNGAHLIGGGFRNEGMVPGRPDGVIEQSGPLEIEGRGGVYTWGTWAITRPVAIRGEGAIVNGGNFTVLLEVPGTVEVASGFENAISEEIPFGGTVTVGRPRELGSPSPATTLRFGSRFANLQGGALGYGHWKIGRAATLEVAEDVFSIPSLTIVEIDGGSFPALKLGQLFGSLHLRETSYVTPGSLAVGADQNNNFWSSLRLQDASLTVPGPLSNFGRVDCGKNSTLTVGGDFNHQLEATMTLAGRLVVRGTLYAIGSLKVNGGSIEAPEVIGLGPIEPGESPGTLALTGTLSLGATAEVSMEIAGREPGKFDLITVSGAATLGGMLIVPLLDNFAPAPADTFAIIQAAAITGRFANVASGQRVFAADGRGSFEVHYGTGSALGANRVVLANWQPAGAGAPSITRAPLAQTIKAGAPLTLTVGASGPGPLTYQWRFRGAPIAGATQATFTVPGAQGYDQGGYSVVVTNAAGSIVTAPAMIAVDRATSSVARVSNLSTRALGPAGSEAFISGFVLQGTGNARMLLRTIGPGLGAFGVPNVLPNPQMIVQRLAGANYVQHAANTDWGANANAPAIIATTQSVGGFPLAANSLDSALLLDLAAGQYSVVASDSANRAGTAIIELYDATAAGAGGPRLVNISTRGFVGAGGDVMIPGFVVSPEGARTLLVRAVGPTLAAFGVPGALSDPQITLYRREPGGTDTPVFTNNDWGTSPVASTLPAIAGRVGAFALPAGSRDAALLVTLQPGAYTVHASGVGGATGTALVEIYLVP